MSAVVNGWGFWLQAPLHQQQHKTLSTERTERTRLDLTHFLLRHFERIESNRMTTRVRTTGCKVVRGKEYRHENAMMMQLLQSSMMMTPFLHSLRLSLWLKQKRAVSPWRRWSFYSQSDLRYENLFLTASFHRDREHQLKAFLQNSSHIRTERVY